MVISLAPSSYSKPRLSHVTLTKKGTRVMPATIFRTALGLRRLGICRQNTARCMLLGEGERERVHYRLRCCRPPLPPPEQPFVTATRNAQDTHQALSKLKLRMPMQGVGKARRAGRTKLEKCQASEYNIFPDTRNNTVRP